MKALRFALLATTALVAVQPGDAQAMPPAIAAIGAVAGSAIAAGTVLGSVVLASILGAAVTLGTGILANALSGRNNNSGAQRDQRTRQFDPHPPFRFAFGEFPLEGSVVFHHSVGQAYYFVVLLNSVASEAVTRIEINDGVALEFADISDATNLAADHNPTNAPWSDFAGTKDATMNLHIGLGDQTAPPSRWLAEIGPGGTYSESVITPSDSWAGATVAFIRLIHGGAERAARRWAQGKPPPMRFFGQWSKVYDPRLDSTSGVTGASGAHRPDDPTTWAYSANAALCALMLARHEYALGRDDESIPIQQWADAADACEGDPITVSAFDTETWRYLSGALGTTPDASGAAYDDSGWSTTVLPVGSAANSDVTGRGFRAPPVTVLGLDTETWLRRDFEVTTPQDVRFSAYVDNGITVWVDGVQVHTHYATFGGKNDFTIDAADWSVGTNKVAIKLVDDATTGGIDITYFDLKVETEISGDFRCDGLVVIEEREVSLLDPVLACFGGTLDSTDGLLGVRAGVWAAATGALSEPIGDEIEIVGAEDEGYDSVRAKYISRERDYQETDGQGYSLRSGARERPLHLPLVREPFQAARLEKIAAHRGSPRRRITATFDGREAERRIGERVTFALDGQPRAAGTYLIESKSFTFEQEGDGLRMETRLTLVHDQEATYQFDYDDFDAPAPYTPPTQSTPSITAPTGCELTIIERPGQWTEGETQLYIRQRFLPVEGADQYDVEVYTEPYSVGDNDFGGTTDRILVPADQTIDDSGTTKVEHIYGPVVAGVDYRFRVWSRASGLGQSDTYLECTTGEAAPPSAVLDRPEVISVTHDGASATTHRLRSPDSPNVQQLRLSGDDNLARSDLVVIATVPSGPALEGSFVDAQIAGQRRYLRAVAIDQFGREGTHLDYDFTPGETVPGDPISPFVSEHVAVMPWLGIATWPSGIHVAATNKTIMALERVVPRENSVAVVFEYDHATGLFSTLYDVGSWNNPDDAHGQPAVHRMTNGYLLAFFGAHDDDDQPWAISASADDISSWNRQTDISGNYTYPKPNNIGSDVHILWRKTTFGSPGNYTLVTRSGTPSGASLPLGPEIELIDLGPDSRIYIGMSHVRNTDEIHFVGCRSDYNDTGRKHVYYFVYDVGANEIRNYAGTTTITSANYPVDLTEANADFRLIDSGSNVTFMPALAFDSDGNPHILFGEGLATDSVLDVMHMWNSGSGWSTPAKIGEVPNFGPAGGNFTGFVEVVALFPGADSKMEAWWPTDTGDVYARGGDKEVRRVWGGASWAPEETMYTAQNGRPLAHPSPIRDAHPDLRVKFSELVESGDYADAVPLELLFHGDSGGLTVPASPVVQYPVANDFFRLQVNDDGDVTDVTWAFTTPVDLVTNNVTAVSGRVDWTGTASYVTIDNSAFWNLVDDFTIQFRDIDFDSTSGIATLIGRQDEGAGLRDWRVIYTAGAIYFQANIGAGFATILQHTWTPTLGTEYDIVFERDGATLYLYIDDLTSGNHVASAAMATDPTATTSRVTAGASYSTFESNNHYRHFNGAIGQLRASDVAEIRGA